MRATFETGCVNGWGADEGATWRVAHTRRTRFGGVILALLSKQGFRWRAFLESLMTAIHYVRYTPGATDRLSAKCPVCSLYFSDPGNDASCRLENARYAKVGARSA
jgi:hypothetical protein